MTPVKFKFLTPLGTPIALQEFHVSLNKAAFHSLENGFIPPDVITATTDADGVAEMLLFPANQPYYVTMAFDEEINGDICCTGIRFRIAVPDTDVPQWADKLVVKDPIFSQAWDAEAIEIIMNAKNQAAASAAAAKESELVVLEKAEEVAANTVIVSDKTVIAVNAAAAASLSETNSKASELASKNSQDAARASELAAQASAEFAAGAVQDMQEQVDEATAQAVLAGQYKDAAALSAGSAQTNANKTAADVVTTGQNVATTEANKQATAQDVITVTGLKSDVTDLKDETKGYRDQALEALGTITGVISDGGQIDLSGGAYPTKPQFSTVWRVTTGGVVDGIDFAVGDQLFYTKENDYFYKQDGTENVHSVAGKKGDVLLVKADVGLPLVDNTSDVNKPVSLAQQAQFNLRTPTTSRLDMVAGHLVKVGDYGDNGGPAIPRINTDDANALTVAATYAFANGGVNVPEAVYLKHIDHETDGYAKQIAYGILTDKQYVRTQIAGVWSNWTSAVEIIDALTSTDPTKALSAKQGKVLYDLLLANNATIVRYNYSLASGVNVISGADINGKTLSYVPGTPMIVDKDGFAIQLTKDYTASNGTSLVLAVATEQACEITITVFGAFTVADHYTKEETNVLLQNVAAQSAEALLTVKWVPSRDMVGLGTVPLDGGTYSRTTYPDAWILIRDGKVPKTTEALWTSDLTARASFTEGDGSTTFRVPDYNGKSAGSLQALFVRGDGNSADVAGKIQRDAYQAHDHAQGMGGVYLTQSGAGGAVVAGKAPGSLVDFTGPTQNTQGVVTGRSAAETRPVNVAGVWTIRLFGSTSNVGNVDVAQLAANLATVSNKVTVIETTFNKLTLDAVQPTTSGTTKDFVIPTNAKRITLFFNQLSLNGSAYVLARLGAGSLQTAGYLATSTVFLNSGVTVGTFASGFGFGGTAAGNVVQGSISFTHMGNNIWIANGSCQYSNTGASALISGSVTLTGPLDRLQVNTSTGTDVFDLGSCNVLVEV